MPVSDLSSAMAEFLRLLAGEVENNRALARRLAVPFTEMLEATRRSAEAPSKSRKSAPAIPLPEDFDPFRIYMEREASGLHAALENMDSATLKRVLAEFSLAPAESYQRKRKEEMLRQLILDRVEAMTGKGRVFLPNND